MLLGLFFANRKTIRAQTAVFGVGGDGAWFRRTTKTAGKVLSASPMGIRGGDMTRRAGCGISGIGCIRV